MKRILICSGLIALTACSNAIPPSRSGADLTAAELELARIDAITTPGVEPTGSANFAGLIGGPLEIDGDIGSEFLGDIEMRVDFGIGEVDGSIEDITLFDDGVPDQDLGGRLAVTGTYGSTLNATANGTLTAVEDVGAFGLDGETNVTMNITGVLVDDGGTNTLVGDVTGSGTGDYDVFLPNGVGFFAAEEP